MSGPRLSVIVCTRNRAGMLPGLFDSLAAQPLEASAAEIIVVDNASRDSTPEVLRAEAARGRLPLRVIDEPAPGLSVARNTGIGQARGDFVIFLDDDALAAPGWLRAYEEAAAEQPILQGRILVSLDRPPPSWMTTADLKYLSHLDQGDRAAPLVGNLFGANFGVRRDVFTRVGTFRTDLGAGQAGYGEDTDFSRRAVAAGFQLFYLPKALIHHRIPPERLTRRAVLRRHYLSGFCQPLFESYSEPTARLLAGLAKEGIRRGLRAIFTLDPARRMSEIGNLAQHAGRVRQILRLRLRAAGR